MLDELDEWTYRTLREKWHQVDVFAVLEYFAAFIDR